MKFRSTRSNCGVGVRRRWLVVLASLWCLCVVGSAAAQPVSPGAELVVEQPVVLERVLLSDVLFGYYPGPDHASTEREMALREIADRVYQQSFGRDVRTRMNSSSIDGLESRAVAEEPESVALLVRQLELGRRLYRAGEIREAIEALEAALTSSDRAYLQWSHPDMIAESLEVLSLAYLEAHADGIFSTERVDASLRVALRDWIRIRPGQRIDGRRYPMTFVEAWRQAYFDQLETSAALLAIRMDEARVVSSLLAIDLFVDVRILQGPRGSSVSVRFYDAIEDRFAYDALLAWDGTDAGLEDVLSRAFSSANACIPLRYPEVDRSPKKAIDSIWLNAGWAGFFFLDAPTDHVFLNQGLELYTQLYFTPVVGIYADTLLTFSSRDVDGVLLRPIQTQTFSLGLSVKYERNRFRIFIDGGLDVGRRSTVLATREFWCRISGGEVMDFGSAGSCTLNDLTRSDASVVFGVKVRAGLSVRVASSFWLYTTFFSTTWVVPFEGRAVDRPLGLSAGGTLRF